MLTQPNILAAFLYLRQSDEIPAPVLDKDGNLIVELDNLAVERWSEMSSTPDISYDIDRLARFISYTGDLLIALEELELDPSEPAPAQYMTLFYDAAKETFDHDKNQLRTYFMWLYYVLYHRPQGSRWGDMVDVMGVEGFNDMVRAQFRDLI
jgi:lysyl-tRNA synthetase class I